MTAQLPLPLAAEPILRPSPPHFWCCGACVALHHFGSSLIWQPPDYREGICVFCGRQYTFQAARGGKGAG